MTWHPEKTDIVRDMQQTANQLGIVDLLIEHERLSDASRPDWNGNRNADDFVREALHRLGVTNDQIQEKIECYDRLHRHLAGVSPAKS